MLSFLCKQWRSFLLAVGFFTRIPVPRLPDFQEQELNHAAKYFPLVGIIVGLAGAAVFVLAIRVFQSNIAILLSMAATICLTGAFHEDGLADSADGLGGGWDSERILTIMQDSRLGTYGAIALFLMLFSKFQLLNALPAQFVAYALIIAHAASRLCAVYVMATCTYVKASGKAKPLASKVQVQDIFVATVFGLLPMVLLFCYFSTAIVGVGNAATLVLCMMLPACVVWFWWRQKIQRWIGGYTGDCLGAMQQMTELAFYLGFVAYFGLISKF